MRKIYFTKYLPVKDEPDRKPQSDDLFIFKIKGKWTEPASFNDLLGADIQEVKRVELFLCSRDIKVGDLVRYKESEFGNWKCNEVDIDSSKNDNQIFKVIGKVSSSATWVKEGDEFNESNFYLELRCKKVPIDTEIGYTVSDLPHLQERVKLRPNFFEIQIKFKCPTCKTYH